MSSLDNVLIQKYRTMIGLNNINNYSGNTIITGNVTINSNLNILGNSIIENNTTINSSLTISGNSIFQGNLSINSSLVVSGNSIINGTTTILSNLFVSNNTTIFGNLYVSSKAVLNNSVTILSNLNVSGLAQFQNGIITNTINPLSDTLNINGNIINIGNSNSIINIIGTTNYVASNDVIIVDKVISLNLNSSTGSGFDNGGSCGIQIYGTNGIGFIKTTSDASNYQILPPSGGPVMYIATLDLNNNLYISGTTTVNNNTSILSQLFVSGNSIIYGSTTINSNLSISGNTILNGATTLCGSLYVSGSAILNGNTTVMGILSVSNDSCINGNTTINGSLLVSGSSILIGTTTILGNLSVSGNTTLYGFTTINGSLYVSSNANFYSDTTINSSLLINGNTIIGSDVSILSNLYVSNTTIINSSVSFNSNLTVSGNSIISGNNITLGSSLSNFNILGTLITQLPEYLNNTAASAAGIPIWGLYRTGGIIKIRLDDIPPIIYLSGLTTITSTSGLNYIDPGVYAIDNIDGNITPYLISISNTSTSNIITTPIAINGPTIISNVNILSIGSYTITYNASDNTGNIGYNSRNLNIC